MRDYLLRHYRGELPLWQSYWVNGILLAAVLEFSFSLLFGFVFGVVLTSINMAWILHTKAFINTINYTIVGCPLVVFFNIGIIRSAARRGGFWGGLAIVLTCLGILSAVIRALTGPFA